MFLSMCQAWWFVLWMHSDGQIFVQVLPSTKSPLKCRCPQEANGMSCWFMSEARTNTDIDHTGQVSLGFWDLKLTYLLVRWFYWSEASSSLWWEGLLSWKLLFAVHLNASLRMFHIVREGGWYWLLEWDTWATWPQLSASKSVQPLEEIHPHLFTACQLLLQSHLSEGRGCGEVGW